MRITASPKKKLVAGRETSPVKTGSAPKSSRIGSAKRSTSTKSKKDFHEEEHARHLIRALQDAFGLSEYSLPRLVEKQSRLWVERFRGKTSIEKIMKWFYGNSLAWLTCQNSDTAASPDPSLPNDLYALLKPGVLFVGKVARFLRSVFRRHSKFYLKGTPHKVRRALSVGQTLLMLKKGSPVVSADLVREAQAKHKTAMSAAGKGVHAPSRISRDLKSHVTDDLLYNTIDDVIREVFPVTSRRRMRREGLDPSMRLAPFPSLSAHFTSKRETGGAASVIVGLWQDACLPGQDPDYAVGFTKDDGPLLDLVEERSRELHKFKTVFENDDPESFASVTAAAIGDIPQGVDSIERELAWLANIRRTLRGKTVGLGRRLKGKDVDEDHPDAQKAFWDLIQEELDKEDFRVTPIYLREPLKVRTITKGPEVAYWVLRDVQRFLWRVLKDHPTFELIGTPLTAEVLNRLRARSGSEGGWLSGDYSAATDNLRKNLTVHAWRSVCERVGFPSWVRKVGEKALVEHEVVYKDETIKQENGQLMGSVLSFPILCIINAAICRIPFDLDTSEPESQHWADYGKLYVSRRTPLRNLPILVNGDDCVMRFKEWQKDLWAFTADRCGMAPSPGKCYYTPRWLQMNSDLYYESAAGFERIPFLNFSLASLTKAKGGGERGLNALGSSAREFVAGFKGEKREKVLSIWLRRMAPTLKKVIPDGMSWGLPEWFGGVGIPIAESRLAKSLSPMQMALASYCYNRLLKEGSTVTILPSEDSSAPDWVKAALRKAALFTRVELAEDEFVPMPGYIPDATSSFTPFLWSTARGKYAYRKDEVGEQSAKRNFQRVLKSVVKAQKDGLELATLADLTRFKRVKSSVPEWVTSTLDRVVDAPRNVLAELLARTRRKQGTSS